MKITITLYLKANFIHSYRIENAMQIHMSQDINLQKENLIHKSIICAVDIHRKAMKLVSIP